MEDEVKKLSLEIYRYGLERKHKKLGDQSRGANIQLTGVQEMEKGGDVIVKEIIQEKISRIKGHEFPDGMVP